MKIDNFLKAKFKILSKVYIFFLHNNAGQHQFEWFRFNRILKLYVITDFDNYKTLHIYFIQSFQYWSWLKIRTSTNYLVVRKQMKNENILDLKSILNFRLTKAVKLNKGIWLDWRNSCAQFQKRRALPQMATIVAN